MPRFTPLLACALMPLAACAQALPDRPEGPVLDGADVLSAGKEIELDQTLRTLLDDTGNALVFVSVSTLNGYSIEHYANDLFNRRGIGDAETNRGLLLLVAPNERKVRIEVGCGLEATIPDATAKEIIERDIIPHYRSGDLEAGSLAGIDSLIDQLGTYDAANDNEPHTPICRQQQSNAL